MLYSHPHLKRAAVALLLLFGTRSHVVAEEPAEALRQFYVHSGGVLSSCVLQVFGRDAKRLDGRLLSYEGRPNLNFDRTRLHLSSLRQHLHPGRLIDGLSVPPPHGGKFGTIVVVRELHPAYSRADFLRTYVHELGNLLDYSLHPRLEDPLLMRHYGDPRDPGGDDDTGQRLERCLEVLRVFEPGSSLIAGTNAVTE